MCLCCPYVLVWGFMFEITCYLKCIPNTLEAVLRDHCHVRAPILKDEKSTTEKTRQYV